MTMVALYVVFANGDEAERIARLVVDERLAACVNLLGPCRSFYRWNGAVEQAEEVPAIIKSDSALVDVLIERIATLHSYDIPAIAIWPVAKALGSYAEWVAQSIGVS